MARFAVFAALVAALAFTGPAWSASRTDATIVMDDGTEMQITVHLPAGTPPEDGWPGIVMVHALGVDRRSTNTIAESVFVPNGYAVLTYDLRGHHESGGRITLAGTREIEDVRALVQLLGDREDVDEKRIGGWGIAYGGAQTWLAAARGVPFAAIVTVQTWTDLYAALFPGDVPKSGVIGSLLNQIPVGKLATELEPIRLDALLGRNLERLRNLANERSVLGALPSMRTPALIVHGRRDFAFGLEQATEAFQRLAGPKRLYVGLNAQMPAAFPAADTPYVHALAVRWFDRFLEGQANGVDTEPAVEIARDPFVQGRAPAPFAGLPPTRAIVRRASGSVQIGPRDRAVAVFPRVTTATETFGSGVARVIANATAGWSRIVALATAVTPAGREIVIGAGAARAIPGRRTYSIALSGNVTLIPRNSVLRLTVAASTVGTAGGLLYLESAMPSAARLRFFGGTLSLPALTTAVSR